MTIEHLATTKAFALIGEMTSTRNLLGYGVKVLRGARFPETTRDPIMTMLSIGVEKLLKLTVGVVSLDETQAWPSKKTMMSYGHGIAALFDHVMAAILDRTTDSSDYVRDLVAGVLADPVLPPLLAALDRYGMSGRFYNLDMLADVPQVDPDPSRMWDSAEQAALGDPGIAELQRVATERLSDNGAWDSFYSAVQGHTADSIEQLWLMISRVGINNALGTTGATLGWEIAPDSVGRQS
ncbi:hypothetical protein JF66_21555 [Cryobacterium sp. MLB-32]|uniref:hypothetical protein n=1 Tax=Cryobacterium sp. MLB-32 TaxID=1529318 RepID=UPI0004E7B591|nr:hypothetical protein [Cryobacterium sp. MLB-32]KFF58046.1 hypothetical protein JF66_21555 [Cryobacterium sp. MLB-32]